MDEEIILLRNDSIYKDEPFPFVKPHAENLLKYQEEKGYNHYTLPTDSDYEFINGNLNRKSGKGVNKIASKPKSVSEGETN